MEKSINIGHLLLTIVGMFIVVGVTFGRLSSRAESNAEAIKAVEVDMKAVKTDARLYTKESVEGVNRHIDDKFEGLEKLLDAKFKAMEKQIQSK